MADVATWLSRSYKPRREYSAQQWGRLGDQGGVPTYWDRVGMGGVRGISPEQDAYYGASATESPSPYIVRDPETGALRLRGKADSERYYPSSPYTPPHMRLSPRASSTMQSQAQPSQRDVMKAQHGFREPNRGYITPGTGTAQEIGSAVLARQGISANNLTTPTKGPIMANNIGSDYTSRQSFKDKLYSAQNPGLTKTNAEDPSTGGYTSEGVTRNDTGETSGESVKTEKPSTTTKVVGKGLKAAQQPALESGGEAVPEEQELQKSAAVRTIGRGLGNVFAGLKGAGKDISRGVKSLSKTPLGRAGLAGGAAAVPAAGAAAYAAPKVMDALADTGPSENIARDPATGALTTNKLVDLPAHMETTPATKTQVTENLVKKWAPAGLAVGGVSLLLYHLLKKRDVEEEVPGAPKLAEVSGVNALTRPKITGRSVLTKALRGVTKDSPGLMGTKKSA